ncbi:MAG TPA: ATP-binding protein, partial [Nevskiaceae bacterium]
TVRLVDYVEARADHLRLLYPGVVVVTRVPGNCRERTIRVQPSLAHALLSLMQNAWQASRRNGSAVVTLAATAYGERVEFVVGDEGSGFAEERAGDLFASGGASHGLGIGLALARATIERMHGGMEAHSGASGSEVRVELPMEPAGS